MSEKADTVLTALRLKQWERCKGELHATAAILSVEASNHPDVIDGPYEQFVTEMDRFINFADEVLA